MRVEADFGVFLGLDRDSSPSQGGFEDELWAGGLKDGQTFSYPGKFLIWRSFFGQEKIFFAFPELE